MFIWINIALHCTFVWFVCFRNCVFLNCNRLLSSVIPYGEWPLGYSSPSFTSATTVSLFTLSLILILCLPCCVFHIFFITLSSTVVWSFSVHLLLLKINMTENACIVICICAIMLITYFANLFLIPVFEWAHWIVTMPSSKTLFWWLQFCFLCNISLREDMA